MNRFLFAPYCRDPPSRAATAASRNIVQAMKKTPNAYGLLFGSMINAQPAPIPQNDADADQAVQKIWLNWPVL